MKDKYKGIPLLTIRAASGTGKTTLLTKIIPLLKSRGVSLGCIKHTHHSLTLDTKGKDSFRLKEAGVNQMLVGDSKEWMLLGTNAKERNTSKRLVTEIRPRGSIIVFPSFVWHRVTPVTKGTRYSLVVWSLGYPFK